MRLADWSLPVPLRRFLATAVIGVAVVVTSPPVSAEGPRRLEIEMAPHGTLRWDRGSTPVLMVRPHRGDGWISIAGRLCGNTGVARLIRGANGGMDHPLRDRSVKVPVELIRADLRLAAVQRLFPADARISTGYRHWVLDPFGGGEESWAWLADVFTGLESNSTALRRANPDQAAAGLRRARPIVVPEKLLLSVFRQLRVVETATPTPAPTVTRTPVVKRSPTPSPHVAGATSANGVLTYGEDGDGAFALYRLRQGEALYSAVVVRFTGQLLAVDVIATALEIAERSGIADVTSIPIDFPVKIPIDLMLPDYLPTDHPRRQEWLAKRKELARFLEVVDAADLSGVHVVIDAGHGGKDAGATVGGLWESTYVYDIACRIKVNLERHTRASVSMIRRDGKLGFNAPNSDRLIQHRSQYLLTNPRYDLESSKIGVHLRWCLGNDVVRRNGKNGVPRSKFVFLSVHADSLHSSVRGAMVYVAGRNLRSETYSFSKSGMDAFAEYRENRLVEIDGNFRARAEASSRHLAGCILESLRGNDVAVHAHQPLRDRVIHGRKHFVPAVLKYSTAQNAILVECCNLSNVEDRQAIVDRTWRERFARAVVEGMAEAF